MWERKFDPYEGERRTCIWKSKFRKKCRGGEKGGEGGEGRKGFWEMSYTDRAPPPPLMEKKEDEEKESF